MGAAGSFRGCDICHKWKKKCDQEKPKCSLCVKLNVKCVGAGQQRLRFKDQTNLFPVASNSRAVVSRPQKKAPIKIAASRCQIAVSKPPSNSSTRLAASVLHLFETTHVGHNTGWMLPEVFLGMIGSSSVLDISLTALTYVLKSLRAPAFQADVASLRKYTRALSSVRKSIADLTTRYEVETVAAVYVLTICQPLMTNSGDESFTQSTRLRGHLSALDHLGSVLSQQKVTEALHYVLDKCATQLLLAATYNSDLSIPSWIYDLWGLWEMLPATSINPAERGVVNRLEELGPWNPKSSSFYCFNAAETAVMVETIRDPRPNVQTIQHFYRCIKAALPLCIKYCRKFPVHVRPTHIRKDNRLSCWYGEAQGFMISFGIIYNAFLRVSDPQNNSLRQDRLFFCAEALRLARECKNELPISALEVPGALLAAWCVTEDHSIKKQLRQLLEDYRGSWAMSHMLHCIPNWREAPKRISQEIPWIPPFKYGQEEWLNDYDTEMWHYCSVM